MTTIENLATRRRDAITNQGHSLDGIKCITGFDERTIRGVVAGKDCKLSTLAAIANSVHLELVLVPKVRARAVLLETAEQKVITRVDRLLMAHGIFPGAGGWAKT